VVAGDLLISSGLGGGFPAGYPVATVIDVKRDPAASLADVDARPAAALDRSRELLFVWAKPAATAAAAPPTAPTSPAVSTPAPAVPAVTKPASDKPSGANDE
jgi:rod shape-determining protein MreC